MNTQLNYRALQRNDGFQQLVHAVKHHALTRQAAIWYGVAGCFAIGAAVYATTRDGDSAEMLFTLAGITVVLSIMSRKFNRMEQFAKDNGFAFQTGYKAQNLLRGSGAFNATTDITNNTRTGVMWQISGTYDDTPFAIGSLSVYRRELIGNHTPFKERYVGVIKIDCNAAFAHLFCRSKSLEAGMTIFDASLIQKQPDWIFAPFGSLNDALYSCYIPQGDTGPDDATRQQFEPFLKSITKIITCDIELNGTSIILYTPNGIDMRPEGMQKLFSIISMARTFFNGNEPAGPQLLR